jgi:hypothetical protein
MISASSSVREARLSAPAGSPRHALFSRTRRELPFSTADLGRATGLGDAGELLDAQAKAEYKQRLEDLRAELDQATEWGDSERAARLREEVEFLSEELSAAYGIGGRARKGADTAERIRKAVSNRIRDSIVRIERESPALAEHLSSAVRMGIFCSYSPDRFARKA